MIMYGMLSRNNNLKGLEMSDERRPPVYAPHQVHMNFAEFDWYCEFNARPGVTPLTIIDELYERGQLNQHQFLRYMMFAQRIYWDNMSTVNENAEKDVWMKDLRGHVEH